MMFSRKHQPTPQNTQIGRDQKGDGPQKTSDFLAHDVSIRKEPHPHNCQAQPAGGIDQGTCG
jgi:hypothetical protein